MTKAIRVENADTGDYKVVVQLWDKGPEGTPDVLAEEISLDHPTAMTQGVYIHSTRYLVVKEKPPA